MDETLFISRAEALLQAVEDSGELAAAGADADRSGNVLTLEFDSGSQIVINIQVPTRQVWLASRAVGGYHFSPEGGAWLDSEGREFWSVLRETVSKSSDS